MPTATLSRSEEISDRLQSLVKQVQALDQNQSNHFLRAFVACMLTIKAEQLQDLGSDPVPALNQDVGSVSDFLLWAGRIASDENFKRYFCRIAPAAMKKSKLSAEKETGAHYSDLWVEYDDEAYFKEALDLVADRFKLNNVPLDWVKGKRCIDSGCGGGRYTVALAKLGARKSVGVDVGVGSIQDAKKRAKKAGIKNVQYVQSSVLKLPFPDESFEFAFSNGVLHHTVDPEKGFAELHRVLTPGGKLWLHIAETGGVNNDLINVMRAILKPVPREFTRQVMGQMGFDARRRFYFMDVWYAPIRIEYTGAQVEDILARHGFKKIRRVLRDVTRPTYTGISEMVYQKFPHAEFWYGEGEHRYVAEK